MNTYNHIRSKDLFFYMDDAMLKANNMLVINIDIRIFKTKIGHTLYKLLLFSSLMSKDWAATIVVSTPRALYPIKKCARFSKINLPFYLFYLYFI